MDFRTKFLQSLREENETVSLLEEITQTAARTSRGFESICERADVKWQELRRKSKSKNRSTLAQALHRVEACESDNVKARLETAKTEILRLEQSLSEAFQHRIDLKRQVTLAKRELAEQAAMAGEIQACVTAQVFDALAPWLGEMNQDQLSDLWCTHLGAQTAHTALADFWMRKIQQKEEPHEETLTPSTPIREA